ncbi:MAG: YidC/Oxa1 family membrane protein insertase [Anaerolineales bacterium]|nr:YidC/Oxa1 family membrane protein insertase [Anaerolineales bacterium]MCX7608553.1 YidC/Oxa1 family membrane protein insertase [Anaerolineales bacterium]MDW8227063.1 YidC/Oxa1 family membrane protein insertase [Anaerolineales bacterium]
MWEAIVNLFSNILLIIYKYMGGNFGVAIILFTILSRLALYPLMQQQIKGTQAMQELQNSKEWQEIQKKYKDDREKLAQEQLRLYRELGINPFASCLPTLIQLPIMFALYQSVVRALASTPAQLLILQNAVYPILGLSDIIPINSKFLWMNLAQPERLYVFGVGIPVLAILTALTTYLQTKLTTPPPANPNDQSAIMSKTMALYMPFFMGWITYTLASGLAVYIIVSNLLGIAQYAMMGKVNWSAILPGKTVRRKQK